MCGTAQLRRASRRVWHCLSGGLYHMKEPLKHRPSCFWGNISSTFDPDPSSGADRSVSMSDFRIFTTAHTKGIWQWAPLKTNHQEINISGRSKTGATSTQTSNPGTSQFITDGLILIPTVPMYVHSRFVPLGKSEKKGSQKLPPSLESLTPSRSAYVAHRNNGLFTAIPHGAGRPVRFSLLSPT